MKAVAFSRMKAVAPVESDEGTQRAQKACCWTEACTGVRKIGASHVAVQRAQPGYQETWL